MPKGNPHPTPALQNLQPYDAPLKHGAYRILSTGMSQPCNKCLLKSECGDYRPGATCRVADELLVDTVAEIMSQPGIEAFDRHLATQLGKALVATAVLDSFISRVGLFTAEKNRLTLQPAIELRTRLTGQIVNLCQALSLTPATRRRLQQQVEDDAGARLREAVRELVREETNTIDAEAVSSDDANNC